MITDKTALEYTEKLREYINKTCNENLGINCGECDFYEFCHIDCSDNGMVPLAIFRTIIKQRIKS